MKIDKTNAKHWLWLCEFGIISLAAGLIRFFIPTTKRKNVILYGHKLNGNLLGIYQAFLDANNNDPILFLTMDKPYFQELKKDKKRSILATTPYTALELAKARCIISDHGLHCLAITKAITNIKFVDVWHGLPFKGFLPHEFNSIRSYDECWVTSDFIKDIYVEKYGFNESKVIPIGYARTDRLIKQDNSSNDIKADLGIDRNKKVILYAPTWQQDSADRSIIPFNLKASEFISLVSDFCLQEDAYFIFRSHLNSNEEIPLSKNVLFIPGSDYPDTESILLISDILICDWSSIAFDFLLLERPTIFLDQQPPFKNGFTLDPENRFGNIVSNLNMLLATIRTYLRDPNQYTETYAQKAFIVKERLYDLNADGNAGKRAYDRVQTFL